MLRPSVRRAVVAVTVGLVGLAAVGALALVLRPGPAASHSERTTGTRGPGWSVAEGGDDPGPGTFGVTLDDPDRGRSLDVTVVVPEGSGTHPLVVFAHGFAACGSDYSELIATVAAAGFVVAAPNSPDSSCGSRSPTRDVAAQAGDLAFTIDVLTDPSRVPAPLAGAITPGRVGVMGHSDGGGAVTRLVLTTADPRVGAAVVLSGALFAPVGPGPFPPVLIVHGTDDSVNDPVESVAIGRAAGDSAWLVAVQGGAHLAPFVAPPTVDTVGTLVADFLRATLIDDSAARARLDADAHAGPLVPWAEASFPAPVVEPPSEEPPVVEEPTDPTLVPGEATVGISADRALAS